MFDKEIEAIAKCTELIKELDDDSKIRVIKYLIERFGIGMQNSSSFQNHNSQKPLISNTDNFDEEMNTPHVDVLNSDYPSLRDLVIKDYPKNEVEWVLVYGFYSSDFGNNTFTRGDILSKYDETNRKTETRRKNMSQSISTGVKKDWYKSLNDNEYILLEEGKKYCREILSGNSTGHTRKVAKKENNSNE